MPSGNWRLEPPHTWVVQRALLNVLVEVGQLSAARLLRVAEEVPDLSRAVPVPLPGAWGRATASGEFVVLLTPSQLTVQWNRLTNESKVDFDAILRYGTAALQAVLVDPPDAGFKLQLNGVCPMGEDARAAMLGALGDALKPVVQSVGPDMVGLRLRWESRSESAELLVEPRIDDASIAYISYEVVDQVASWSDQVRLSELVDLARERANTVLRGVMASA